MNKYIEQIKKFAKENPKEATILGVIAGIILLMIITSFTRPKDKPILEAPFRTTKQKEQEANKNPFYIRGVFPKESLMATIDRTPSFRFSFSEDVSEETIQAEIDPYVELKITRDSNIWSHVWVTPKTDLEYNVEYTLTIKEAKSAIGEKTLQKPYTHKFYLEEGTIPDIM